MLAFTNPRNSLPFVSFEHLASCKVPRRVLLAVNGRKGMSLGLELNLGGLESKWGVLGLCGCGETNRGGGFVGRCCVGDGDWDLEGEILEFMKKSRKPGAFPSKKELVEAGRMDLVEGILREGGWMTLGWDLEDEVVSCRGDDGARQCDSAAPEHRSDIGFENGSAELKCEFSSAGSSSVETLDAYTEEATGIEGILSRLEKERSTAFGITSKERELLDHSSRVNGENIQGVPSPGLATTVFGHDRSSHNGINNYPASRSQDSVSSDVGDSVNNIRPDSWRTWSKQRAGSSDMEFEAAEISFRRKGDVEIANVSGDEFRPMRDDTSDTVVRRTDSSTYQFSPDLIRTHLQNLEMEVSATLQSLKAREAEDPSAEMLNVSDELESQQTEIMRAKNRLRSLRSKIAVLEGKLAMAIMDSQKLAEENQKKINKLRHTLQFIRTTYIIWPNSASVVLLTGSFDGWTTQRKMEKSPTGVHSLGLKLYPGVYEFKFIVDGEWKIDPLRPITCNNGFENNVLTVR